MFDYISGKLAELTPTEAVIDCCGMGFSIQISLQSYEELQGLQEAKLYIHHHLREDDEQLFGFATRDEREMFRLLINVNGIGVGSARMILSSLGNEELRNAILGEDIRLIKSVKGIGIKTAQRVIIELKDKIAKGGGIDTKSISVSTANNAAVEEATTALVMLGFGRAAINKVMPDILKKNPNAKVEDIIKIALQKL